MDNKENLPLFSTESFQLYKVRTYNFTLVAKQAHAIYLSLINTALVPNIVYNADSQLIHFVSHGVQTLAGFLETREQLADEIIYRLLQTICAQLTYLESKGLAFIGFGLDDILILNPYSDTNFICICVATQYLFPIFHNQIRVTNYVSTPDFTSPDVRMNHTIVKRGAVCYAVAELLIQTLFKVRPASISQWLNDPACPVRHTKMGAFLYRCIENQRFLFV